MKKVFEDLKVKQTVLAEAEAAVASAEAAVDAVRRRLEDPDLYTTPDGGRIAARLGAELEAARDVLDAAYARWEQAVSVREQRA